MKINARYRCVVSFVAVALLVASAACTEPAPGYSANNGGSTDVGSDIDDGLQDAGTEDTGGVDDSGMTEDGSTGEDGSVDDSGTTDAGLSCDLEGFTMSGAQAEIVEDAQRWDVTVVGESGNRFVRLFLDKQSGEANVGEITFTSDPAQPRSALLMAENCTDQGCEHLYLAIAGTLEITEFDKTDGGAFEASLRDAQLIEIEFDEDDNVSVVDDGKTWCVEETRLEAVARPLGGVGTCDRNGFNPGGGKTVDASDSALYAEAESRRSDPRDILSLQIFSDFDGAATSPGTYSLDDSDYETCANCLLINTECDRNQGGCQKAFIANAGNLKVESTGEVGDRFTATVSDARLIEVTIDSDTYETRRVEDGETWCLGQFNWNMQIAPAR